MSDQPSSILTSIYDSLTRREIDEWVAAHRIEDLTLDFKTAPRSFETSEERQTLARAISGFANATGGLIVWGVRAVRDADGVDAAQTVEPIGDPIRFLSNLTSYSGSAVSPSLPGVIHRLLDDPSVAVTLVPESDAGPHMANLGVGQHYTRAGSRFFRMEHFQVVDAFNRRRKPDLRIVAHKSSEHESIIVGLQNLGRVSARAPYVEVQADGPWALGDYGQNLPSVMHGGRNSSMDPRFGGSLTTVVHPLTRLDVCMLEWRGGVDARRPVIGIRYAFAAEDLPLTTGTLFLPNQAGAEVMS